VHCSARTEQLSSSVSTRCLTSHEGRGPTLGKTCPKIGRRCNRTVAWSTADQRQRLPKIYLSTDHDSVTAQYLREKQLQRRLAVPGEESGAPVRKVASNCFPAVKSGEFSRFRKATINRPSVPTPRGRIQSIERCARCCCRFHRSLRGDHSWRSHGSQLRAAGA
jgi:hypothetical protein